MGKLKRTMETLPLLFLAFAFVVSTTSGQGVSSSESVLFIDNFDNYAVGNFPSQWTLLFNGMGNQYQQVITDPANYSNRCLQLQGQRDWAADAVRYFQSNANIIGFEVSVLVTANHGTTGDDVKAGLWKQIDWGDALWTDGVAFTDNGTIVARAHVTDEGTGTVLQTYVPGQWYHIRFVLDRPTRTISVWVNDVFVGQNITGSDTPYVFDGFAVSGRYTEIPVDYDNVSIFEASTVNLPTVQQPSLTVYCNSSTSLSGFNVQIRGDLTWGTGIPDAPILLAYSVTGGKSWQDLTMIYTGSDGSFAATWMPNVSGNYLLKAVYHGNENYSSAAVTVDFAITTFDQKVFSVTSNSTISQFSFNTTSRELSFGVSGQSGTTGYVYVNIPKSMLSGASGLAVYLDGNQTSYTYQSQVDSWLLHFTYHHSSHVITINLGSQVAPPDASSTQPSGLNWAEIAVLVFMVIVAAVVVIEAFVIAGRENSGQNQEGISPSPTS
jgi:hypothetical protein